MTSPPMTDADKLAKALEAADSALREHACHGGPDLPCLRAHYQCSVECGRSAGDALLLIGAALAKLREADHG